MQLRMWQGYVLAIAPFSISYVYGSARQHYKISAMPTFIFLKNGKQVDMVRGADPV
jgi:hypothetical protein